MFKHALTQDVAYGSLLSARRRELHAAAARSLESLAGERAEEVQELLAMHYSRAEVHDKAVEHLGAVAAHSFHRHATRRPHGPWSWRSGTWTTWIPTPAMHGRSS